MSSFLSWMAFSDKERRDVLGLVDMFKDREARDELGIGVIRDAIADILFPGTSTIQTRARYFFFIPWMYQKLEEKRVSSKDVKQAANREESRLIEYLSKNEIQTEETEKPTERSGIIGLRAGKNLKRFPSDIYWHGLRTFNIGLHAGGRESYYRSLDGFYLRNKHPHLTLEEKLYEEVNLKKNWHNTPEPPPGFPENASFTMTLEEAEYLKNRIITAVDSRGSLLAYLVSSSTIWDPAPYAWSLPEHLKKDHSVELAHAEKFSLIMHGAAILYNLMLARIVHNEAAESSDYEDLFSEWTEEMNRRMPELQAWDRSDFWAMIVRMNSRVSRAKGFVERWFCHVLQDGRVLTNLIIDEEAKEMIVRREAEIKKIQARLTHESARLNWQGNSGIGRLDFRWRQTQRILFDILKAFHGENTDVEAR